MLVNIISFDKIIYQGEANSINAQGMVGELTILPNHASLITLLKKGNLKLRKDNSEKLFKIEKGILEVNPKEVNVLVTL
jgi:F-type H+-transporting ATPase subunit epsilon